MIYGEKQAGQFEGDYIIETSEFIYIGRLKPGYNRTGDDTEDLPIWQIERIATDNVHPDQDNQNVVEYHTTRKYPNGNCNYEFVMSDFATYTYDFRH